MLTDIMIIDPETDGGVLVKCNLAVKSGKLIVEYQDRYGWVMEIPMEQILLLASEEQHG
jgi:hypothetical protein